MTPEEYQWHINLVKDRYHAYNLTFEQAEKVYQFEKDKDTYSDKHYFSAWEEWDFEVFAFREILNEEQFRDYETLLSENMRRYEQQLMEMDKERASEIAYHQEQINFYEAHVLPGLLKETFPRSGWLLEYKAKIEYLKGEYKRFLNDTKKQILTSHFRHNRTFRPNELKLALLRHKVYYILPEYTYFKHQMDEPTKAVAQFLYSKLRYIPEQIEELLTRKFNEIKEFNEKIFKKYYYEN